MYEPSWFLHVVSISILYKDEDLKKKKKICDYLNYLKIVLQCLNLYFLLCSCSMDGADLCFEIVKRASMGFVYSEAVAR